MVTGSCPSVLPNLTKAFSVISITSLNMMMMMMMMMMIMMSSGLMAYQPMRVICQDGTLTWFGIETAKKISHIIESKIT